MSAGKILDDALMEAEKYIDDVSMAGIEEVVIIHGRGEGILREGIRSSESPTIRTCLLLS